MGPSVLGLYPAALGELQPPPAHAGKSMHWVQHPIHAPEVARWLRASRMWVLHHDATRYSPDAMRLRGYRYLGPAEWGAGVAPEMGWSERHG